MSLLSGIGKNNGVYLRIPIFTLFNHVFICSGPGLGRGLDLSLRADSV